MILYIQFIDSFKNTIVSFIFCLGQKEAVEPQCKMAWHLKVVFWKLLAITSSEPFKTRPENTKHNNNLLEWLID